MPEKATREPSGETCGESAIEPIWVSCLRVGAVIVHLPDFFRAAAIADVVNLGFRNAGDAAAQAEDDFVGKAVRDDTRIGVVRFFAILLAQHLWRLRVLGVVQPALDVERTALNSDVAKRQHVGVGRRTAPVRKVHVLRSARY